MRSKVLLATFLTFFLGACAQNGMRKANLPPLNPEAIIAFYEQHQALKDANDAKIVLAFGKSGFNWTSWQSLTQRFDLSAALSMPLNFKSLFRGEQISTLIAQGNINNPGLLNLISIEKGPKEIPMSSSSKLSFGNLAHPPVLLLNNVAFSNQPSWKNFIASKKLIENTMPSFQSFVENGLLEKNNVRKDDMDVLDAVQFNDNAKILTLSINTLSNRDDLSREKRYKSFYINSKDEMTDLTFEEDVRFEGASTGLNIRFLDAFESNNDMMVFFWIWDGIKTGYRLYRPATNTKVDFWH
ncbi:MAG: hypothetical protein Q8S31_01845 [Alphaproteobacteria bacterium]|nr:hypothetical protein [Alphaproteobacteria bacterium]